MSIPWRADPTASLSRRLGDTPAALGHTGNDDECPDIWELDNGDIVVVGQDLTGAYASRLPADLKIAEGESLVVIPRSTFVSAKADLPDD
ncbi:hypothetical protein [Sinosporangium siamense]|uniref:Uncharacterized protein n=1 Tax=Sinosporangium siamense TaxID=1367973 RepID=A0A919RGU1_9ACTN|nr:hypothetical protein [Sinosporangium siamense]GII93117.1 hypothetical protein Ssi02_33480 [Sinosporangium siamense]